MSFDLHSCCRCGVTLTDAAGNFNYICNCFFPTIPQNQIEPRLQHRLTDNAQPDVYTMPMVNDYEMPVVSQYQQQFVVVPPDESFQLDLCSYTMGTPAGTYTGQQGMSFMQQQPSLENSAPSTLQSAIQQIDFSVQSTGTCGQPDFNELQQAAFPNQPLLALTSPAPISTEGVGHGVLPMQLATPDGGSIPLSATELHLCDGCFYFSMTFMNLRPTVKVIRPSPKCSMRTCNCNCPSNTASTNSNSANVQRLPLRPLSNINTSANQLPHHPTHQDLTPPDSSPNPSSSSSSQSPTGSPSQTPSTPSHLPVFYCSSPGCNRHASAPNLWPFPRKDNRNKHEMDVHGILRPQRQQTPRKQVPRRQRAMMSGAGHRRLVAVTKQSGSQSPVAESMELGL